MDSLGRLDFPKDFISQGFRNRFENNKHEYCVQPGSHRHYFMTASSKIDRAGFMKHGKDFYDNFREALGEMRFNLSPDAPHPSAVAAKKQKNDMIIIKK